MGGFTGYTAARAEASGTGGTAFTVIEAVDLLTCEAAASVAGELARSAGAHGDATPPGHRYQSEDDLVYLIQMLLGSLATGHIAYFTRYVQWLRMTLTSRGADADAIAQSLSLLLAFFERRLPPKQATPVATILKAGLATLVTPLGEDAIQLAATNDDAWPEVPTLTRRLIAGDLAGARTVVSDVAEQRRTYLSVSVRLLQPALYNIGKYWQLNQLSIAQANLAFEICRVLRAELMSWLGPRLGDLGWSIILATVENDRHFLGAQIVADAFDIAGWKVSCLNASFRTSSLVQLVDRQRPTAIGLSVSLLQQLPTLKLAVKRLRSELGSHCPTIIVGGRPTNEIEGIWRWTEADAWSASAETAVAELSPRAAGT